MQGEIHAGDRFGKLMVLERSVGGHGAIRWHCLCDCGNETDCYENSLLQGKNRSCGCKKSPDRTGERFGLLTVLGRSDKRAPRGNRTVPLWKCRCDCGEIVYKAMDALTGGARCSCTDCARKLNAENSRRYCGYADGTQLSRIVSKKPVGENISGRRGVSLDKKNGLWRARIRVKGTDINLGYYSKLEDAVKARERAEEEYYEPLLERETNTAYGVAI